MNFVIYELLLYCGRPPNSSKYLRIENKKMCIRIYSTSCTIQAKKCYVHVSILGHLPIWMIVPVSCREFYGTLSFRFYHLPFLNIQLYVAYFPISTAVHLINQQHQIKRLSFFPYSRNYLLNAYYLKIFINTSMAYKIDGTLRYSTFSKCSSTLTSGFRGSEPARSPFG